MFGLSENKTKPITSIFNTKHDDGGMVIVGRGNTADIYFDTSKKELAQVIVYQLAKLIEREEFKQGVLDTEQEKLVHTWHTKRYNNKIIKYATEDQLAFIFDANTKAEENFNKLYDEYYFNRISYFREVLFSKIIKMHTHLTINELAQIPGMSEKKIQILYKYVFELKSIFGHKITIEQLAKLNNYLFEFIVNGDSNIGRVLELGITIDELAKVDNSQFDLCMNLNHLLRDALKFQTIHQILRLNKISKTIDYKETKKTPNTTMHGSRDGFTQHKINNCLLIKHQSTNSFFEVNIEKALEQNINKKIENIEPEDLVHEWYLFSNISNEHCQIKKFYSPDSALILKETMTIHFPKDLFSRSIASDILQTFDYYREKEFVDYIGTLGYTILELKMFSGITIDKLELLSKNLELIKEFSRLGVPLKALINVEQRHLNYLFHNFSSVENALKFMEISDILGAPEIVDIPILDPEFEEKSQEYCRIV